ncbi:MAG: HAD family phosphatase [Lachnospiraceae bacterium]|nr:HAD family phosphatase [Lachnospiraceae bacterium]
MITKGIIFDVDGTMLDSMHVWKNVGLDYLASVNVEPKENMEDTLRSMSLYEVAHYYKEECNVPHTVPEIIDIINSMIEKFYREADSIKPGVKELLKFFYDNGIKMCVSTATDRYLIEAALEKNGIAQYFEKIFTCNEVGKGKSDPLIYDLAMEFMGTDKESTLIFEDALYAITTAKNAGYRVVAVADRQAGNPEDIKNIADYYLEDYKKFRFDIL